jgi:hypothetical protein
MRRILFALAIGCLIFMGYTLAEQSHPAEEIRPGTFGGTGDYKFPKNLIIGTQPTSPKLSSGQGNLNLTLSGLPYLTYFVINYKDEQLMKLDTVGNLWVKGKVDVEGNLYVKGNVGIGTTSPVNAKLVVDGGNYYAIEGKSIGYIAISGYASSGGWGVYGESDSRVGVFGRSSSGYGVYGESKSSYGVFGVSDSSIGVYGSSTDSQGIAGYSKNDYSGYFWGGKGVYVSGDLKVTGTKNAVVSTSQGERKMSAVEAPTVNFVTAGSSKLVNGEAKVKIEPLFLETINTEAGYKVLLTPMSNCQLYVSNKNKDGFVVRLSSGEKDCSFDWFLYGIRKGYENYYMEKI